MGQKFTRPRILIEPLKPDFTFSEDDIEQVIVKSRMFEEKNSMWKLDTHDTLRDYYSGQFYSNPQVRKTLEYFIKHKLGHPLEGALKTSAWVLLGE